MTPGINKWSKYEVEGPWGGEARGGSLTQTLAPALRDDIRRGWNEICKKLGSSSRGAPGSSGAGLPQQRAGASREEGSSIHATNGGVNGGGATCTVSGGSRVAMPEHSSTFSPANGNGSIAGGDPARVPIEGVRKFVSDASGLSKVLVTLGDIQRVFAGWVDAGEDNLNRTYFYS